MYGVNWVRFIWERVSSPLRQPIHLAWLKALLQPVISLHDRFLNFEFATRLDMSIGPSVRELQYWLNELYDTSLQRIEIRDYEQLDTLYIFLESENRPVYLPTFIGASNYDFEVRIPCALFASRATIRGFLDRYKLATKRYLITWTGLCPVGIDPYIDDE
jgi:hypothetical protein